MSDISLPVLVLHSRDDVAVSKLNGRYLADNIPGAKYIEYPIGGHLPWYEERENILSFIKQAGLIALILNISMMVIAYYIAKAFASGVKQMKCIALECGLQNGTLALFVSTQIFGTDILYALPTGAYALIMYITGFIFIYFLRKSN